MDFKIFSVNMTKHLIMDNFKFSKRVKDRENIFTFVKIDYSGIYIVNIINSDKLILSGNVNELIKNDDAKTIILNILVGEKGSDLYNKYEDTSFVPDQMEYIIPWIVDLSTKKVLVPPMQPDDILNMKKIVESSLSGDSAKKDIDIDKYRDYVEEKNKLKQIVKIPIFTYSLILINIIIFLYMEYKGTTMDTEMLIKYGANKPYNMLNGEYYRLFTSMFLHIGVMHILFNMFSLYLFGSKVERYMGRYKFLFIYFTSGLIGSFFSTFLNDTISAGASGAIYGLIGAIYMFSRKNNKNIEGFTAYVLSVMILVGISLGFLDPKIDNYAHIGGLINGILLGMIL